jgi:hypothetical protein
MSTNKLLDQMLEHLVNDEKEKAEELFHEYVVTKSREIYEGLIEEEMKDDEDDEEVEEASDKEEDEDDEQVDEEFEDIAIEADDDMDDMDDMGGDPTDDLAGELDADMDDEDDDMDDKDPEELFQDLDAIVDELQAKFDAMQGGDEGDMGDMDDEMKDDFDLETVREYVEKVPAGHGAEKRGSGEAADNKKSLIDNMKNDMGGTTANILSSKEEAGTMAGQGTLKGSSLSGQKAKEDNAGNINVPGGKAGGAFSKKEPGHGAEKKGSAEDADKGAGSLFRGRR